ncbi:hypothetical protein [Brevibacillus panacihumi]|nr:hypothetical protein [Brevibacillus panacihumi]
MGWLIIVVIAYLSDGLPDESAHVMASIVQYRSKKECALLGVL